MTISEFVEQTSELEKYYGKELDEFQRKIWNEELGKMPVQRYRQIIKQAYRECKFMPKLADLLEINQKLNYKKDNKENIQKVECKKCNRRRVYIVYKRD